MTDRVPTYPGRVRLTPVAGQENVYDLTLADDAIEQGTPLNKANLLTDATAALLRLSGDPTVNQALAAIASSKANLSYGSYVGTGTYGSSNLNTLTFDFEPQLLIVYENVSASGSGNRQIAVMPAVCEFMSYTFADTGTGESTSNWYTTTGITVAYLKLQKTGNSVKWYNKSNAKCQLNESGKSYGYIAISGGETA